MKKIDSKRFEIGKKYIQNGKRIKRPKGLIKTEPLCAKRSKCLEISFKPGYHDSTLCCNNCKAYKKADFED